jgi:hypothetical protein
MCGSPERLALLEIPSTERDILPTAREAFSRAICH